MLKELLRLGLLWMVGVVLCAGCATPPKSIPAAYFEKDYEMSVKVVRCPASPKMMDSGRGGLIGLAVQASRASIMKKRMRGIQGETVSELLRQKVSQKLENHFDVVEDQEQLASEITVTQWGWFVPSTIMGIKTGSYQLRIDGKVAVYDMLQQKRKRVGYVAAICDRPLGNEPTEEDTQEAVLRAIDDFANKAVEVILRDSP